MVKINNKIILFLSAIFIILALFFNANNFLWFFNNVLWNYNFNNLDYKKALDYHKKAENNIKNNTINYNLWWDYYKLWDFKKSIEYYEKIKTATWEKEDLEMAYNLWNVFYKLWEKEENIETKANLWQESLDNYKKVLDEKEDKKTKENYDFVNEKLNKLENKWDKSNEEKDQKKVEKWDNNKEDNKKDWEKKQDENVQEENKSGQWNWYDIKKDSKLKELNEEEKKQLIQYNEQLKQEQKENWNNFWKKNQGNNEDIFDIFKQDPFFDNFENFNDSLLNQNEKDW